MGDSKIISEINDDTKLIRFLDKNGAEKSIGTIGYGSIICTFHYGTLKHYKNSKTNAGDSSEGSININLGGQIGYDKTVQNALVSCWSIWDGKDDPWIAFENSSFTQKKENICAIVSTVGKVKSIHEQIVELNQKILGDRYKEIVLDSRHGPIEYFPNEIGIPITRFEQIDDPKSHELLERTFRNIFFKRDKDERGQIYYCNEKEYRFATLLGLKQFFGSGMDIALSAENAILRDYELTLVNGIHYIDHVHLRGQDEEIETACIACGITLSTSSLPKSLGQTQVRVPL